MKAEGAVVAAGVIFVLLLLFGVGRGRIFMILAAGAIFFVGIVVAYLINYQKKATNCLKRHLT